MNSKTAKGYLFAVVLFQQSTFLIGGKWISILSTFCLVKNHKNPPVQ